MRKGPRSTLFSPTIIVSSVSTTAGVIPLFFVLLSAAAGCDEDGFVKDVISNAPQMCWDFCQAEYECEWGHGEELDGAKQYFQDQCIVDCAFYTQSGAMIIKRSQTCDDELSVNGDCISPEEKEEPAGRVLGRVVELYFECLWQSNLFQCNDASFALHIEDEAACGRYAECVDLLKSPFFDGITWSGESSSCEIPKQNEGDAWYYLEVIL